MGDDRNYYDAPFIAMIDSGTFWRCPHGHTRFRTRPGCGRCALFRPRHWLTFIKGRISNV